MNNKHYITIIIYYTSFFPFVKNPNAYYAESRPPVCPAGAVSTFPFYSVGNNRVNSVNPFCDVAVMLP